MALLGVRVAVWWESDEGEQPQLGGWPGTVLRVAAEADKNKFFGTEKWDAGDASHTYIVQFSDGQHVHVLRPDKEVDYAGRGAKMRWSVKMTTVYSPLMKDDDGVFTSDSLSLSLRRGAPPPSRPAAPRPRCRCWTP